MPINSQLIAALRGPILLMVFGTLLAVDYAGGMRVVRTWPILIIAFGLLKLLEFAVGNQGPSDPSTGVN
ncbi:MAG: hypothetical protein NW208_19195 [Bryobacter sp.]|nr:hypothetical protein [Bryobacter sp.]